MSNDNCDVCGPHLDRLRTKLSRAYAPMNVSPHFVEDLLSLIAPEMHAAVEQAQELGESVARAVVPAEMA